MASRKQQLSWLRQGKCVECGKKREEGIYVVYPTLCRVCAQKEMRK